MNKLNHIALIMDGNGRWARKRKLNRSRGHWEGARTAWDVIKYLRERNISTVSLFAFSKENWRRPSREVHIIMRLIAKALNEQIDFFNTLGIKIKIIGDQNGLPQETIDAILHAEAATKLNSKLSLIIAVNYSGQYDICQAMESILKEPHPVAKLEPSILQKYLLSSGYPDPDLIIRTGGECRLSNFYLWQSAYTEIHFEKKYWPDFRPSDLEYHIDSYIKAERKYGAITSG